MKTSGSRVLLVLHWFLLVLGLAAALPAAPSDSARIQRVGWLSVSSTSNVPFLKALESEGFVEGRNIAVEMRIARGQPERLPALAEALVASRPDVIFAWGYAAAVAAKRATSTIPIVFGVHVDPVGSHLVDSLARPGANLTGVTLLSHQLVAKRIELLREIAPGKTVIAEVFNIANPGTEPTRQLASDAALNLGIDVRHIEVRNADEFMNIPNLIHASGATVVHFNLDPVFLERRGEILAAALKTGLPCLFDVEQFTEDGGLMSYGPSLPKTLGRAASLVARILRGSRPGDLPVEKPVQVELVINLKAANALGIAFPAPITFRADRTIE